MKQLTRVCSSCKTEKPLGAFLQLDSTRGSSYGNMCSSCRSTEGKNKVKPGDEDSWGLPASGLRIGAKEKAFADKEQFRLKKNLEIFHDQDLKKKEEVKQEALLKTKDKIFKNQLRQRNQLPTFIPIKPADSTAEEGPVLTAEERAQANREKLSEKDFVEKEIRKSVADFSAIFHPLQGRAELDSTTVQGYLDYLGDKAPLTQLLRKGFARSTTVAEKNTSPAPDQQKQLDAQKEKDMSALAKNNWGKKR